MTQHKCANDDELQQYSNVEFIPSNNTNNRKSFKIRNRPSMLFMIFILAKHTYAHSHTRLLTHTHSQYITNDTWNDLKWGAIQTFQMERFSGWFKNHVMKKGNSLSYSTSNVEVISFNQRKLQNSNERQNSVEFQMKMVNDYIIWWVTAGKSDKNYTWHSFLC